MTTNGNHLTRPFVDRQPTANELEIFRLCLSTFQDGSGQLRVKSGTLPGWRDFERTVAEVCRGVCTEDKGIFDVLCQTSLKGLAGLSCKMRKELSRIDRDGRLTIELSNSSRKMWEALRARGITAGNYKNSPTVVGHALIILVRQWHEAAATYQRRPIDMSRSGYLALLWDQTAGTYQLYMFRLELPDPDKLNWYFPVASEPSRSPAHLNGDDNQGGRVFEWYGESGGQLKYYPLAKDALWKSPVFKLEPVASGAANTLSVRAAGYFPKLWAAATAKP